MYVYKLKIELSKQLCISIHMTFKYMLNMIIFLSISAEKIHKSEIKELVFIRGQTAIGKNSRTEQLVCVGFLCYGEALIEKLTCLNTRTDREEPVWSCEAKIKSYFHELYYVNIDCEGLENKDDSFVRIESCSAKYKLKLKIIHVLLWLFLVIFTVFFIVSNEITLSPVKKHRRYKGGYSTSTSTVKPTFSVR
jgi:hypothetical protein